VAPGSTIDVGELTLKTPLPGDRADVAFATWSAPKVAGYWAAPAGRKAFAVAIGKSFDVADPACGVAISTARAVFQGRRRGGGAPLRAIVNAAPRAALWVPARRLRANRSWSRVAPYGAHPAVRYGPQPRQSSAWAKRYTPPPPPVLIYRRRSRAQGRRRTPLCGEGKPATARSTPGSAAGLGPRAATNP